MQINHYHRSKDKSVAKTKDADWLRTMERTDAKVSEELAAQTRVCMLGQTNFRKRERAKPIYFTFILFRLKSVARTPLIPSKILSQICRTSHNQPWQRPT